MTASTDAQRVVIDGPGRGSPEFCLAAGVLLVVAGIFFLVIAPGESVPVLTEYGLPSGKSDPIVNLQRLAMGQTFTICGSIFLAVALRPRR